jgi:hypothetical protein
MEIENDEGLGYVFVKVREIGKGEGERVVIIEEEDGRLEVVAVVLN